MKNKLITGIALLLVIILINTASAAGNYEIKYSGKVTNSSGSNLSGVTVRATCFGGLIVSAVTDSNGMYSMTPTSLNYPYTGTPTCTLQAISTDYSVSQKNVLVTETSGVNFILTRAERTVSMSASGNENEVVTYSGSGTGFVSCSGNACTVKSGLPFNINADSLNFAGSASNNIVSTDSSLNVLMTRKTHAISVLFTPNTGEQNTVSINGDGIISCSGNTCSVHSGLPISITAESINYYGSYLGSVSAPSAITITLSRKQYTMKVNPGVLSTVEFTYDGTAYNACTQESGTIYACSVNSNTNYRIRVNPLTPYNTAYYPSSTTWSRLSENDNSIHDVTLTCPFTLNVIDELTAPVNGGRITSNPISINTSVTGSTSYSYNIVPQDTQIIYSNENTNYKNVIISLTKNQILSGSATINVYRTGRVNLNLTDESGANTTMDSITGINPELASTECNLTGNYCDVTYLGDTLTLIKKGHLINSLTLSPGNFSPLSLRINHTLQVNVTDQNNNSVNNGEIIIMNSTGNELARAPVINGTALVPADPAKNNNDLIMVFNSSVYVRINNTITANTLSNTLSKQTSIKTATLSKLTLNIMDYYNGDIINSQSVRSWNGTTTYCTGNPCEFQMLIAPNNTNVTIAAIGYYNETLINQSVNAGLLSVSLKPTVLLYANTNANITVINTNGTTNTTDDTELMTVQAKVIVSGSWLASVPVPVGTNFMLRINATGYITKIVGPYVAGNTSTSIGSSSNPVILDVMPYVPTGGPVINTALFTPANPLDNQTISASITASDEGYGNNNVTSCTLKIDSGSWNNMQSLYNNYSINASLNMGILTAGNHVITIVCKDSNETLGPEKTINLSVASSELINQAIINNQRLSELENKYDLLLITGLVTPEITNALNNAKEKISTNEANTTLNTAEQVMPLIVLNGGGTIKTTASVNPEYIAHNITTRENQPYTITELSSLIEKAMFTKTAEKYLLDNEPKTVITLKVYSIEANPDAIIADYNPGTSNAENTISTSEGSITYFKGLNKGENVFSYVINAEINQTQEPVLFTMKELSESEKTIKNVTGFTIGIPGFLEVPLVYVGLGAIILFLVLKFLI